MRKSTMFKKNIMKDTFKRSKWEYTVQREALSTPECQEGVPSQGGQQREEHGFTVLKGLSEIIWFR